MAVLRAAVVPVEARFPIHLIVLLACPNPNEFSSKFFCFGLCVHVEKWGVVVGGKLKVIDRKKERER